MGPIILKVLAALLVCTMLGGLSLTLQLIFVGIPFLVTGWTYIIFLMTIFKGKGWVAPIAGLTGIAPAYGVAKICSDLLEKFMDAAGIPMSLY